MRDMALFVEHGRLADDGSYQVRVAKRGEPGNGLWKTAEQAQAHADEVNAEMGLSRDEVADIISSSMRVSGSR